ncbi:ABC transporter ATP-binding protein [Thermaurantiacus sp.]
MVVPASDPQYRLVNVTRRYGEGPAEVMALRGVDLEIAKGEVVILVGPSGSGKSTLLNLLGGLDTPSSGQVLFEGRDLAAMSPRDLTLFRRDHVGFVFQFYNLMPSLTARENVQLVTDIAPDPMTPEEALAAVGLAARADHFPSQMSGGEQQRVAIARAIAKRPAVLLCDEPTGALDSATGIRVLEALLDANRALATTLLIVTHNLAVADLGHRTLRFRDGRVAEEILTERRKAPSEIAW